MTSGGFVGAMKKVLVAFLIPWLTAQTHEQIIVQVQCITKCTTGQNILCKIICITSNEDHTDSLFLTLFTVSTRMYSGYGSVTMCLCLCLWPQDSSIFRLIVCASRHPPRPLQGLEA